MSLIHITGGAGFIGSNLVRYLNTKGVRPIVYDTLSGEKWRNLSGLSFVLRAPDQVKQLYHTDVLVHLGANVNTKEPFNDGLWKNNFEYSLELFKKFSKVIYASSAATYGAEEKDFTERLYGLKQLNAYGFSKWALDETVFGNNCRVFNKQIYGLRFFNVYGPNETHKGDMQSVVSLAINKIKPLYRREHVTLEDVRPGDRFPPTHSIEKIDVYSLFRSTRPDVKDGEQKRDFVYVEDVADVIGFFILHDDIPRGIYNLGSGKARSFVDLIRAVDSKASIDFVPMPDSLRSCYQYFTQADLTKLRAAGYTKPFTELEDGVKKTLALTFPKG